MQNRQHRHHRDVAGEEDQNLTEVAAPIPAGRETTEQKYEDRPHGTRGHLSIADEEQHELTEVAAPPPVGAGSVSRAWRHENFLESARRWDEDEDSPSSRQAALSNILTQIYIVSYLTFFSILGTLARLGVQWITFYPGAPAVFSNIWANFGGTLVMGFLTEDRKIFMEEWGDPKSNSLRDEQGLDSDGRGSSSARAKHGKVKKTIPLFIGLTTGFCGSFTSFSTFMRDVFTALANQLPSPVSHPTASPSPTTTVSRNGGYSFEAVVAVITLTVTASVGALKLGAHLAIATDRITPTLPFRLVRKFLDPLFVLLGIGCWVGGVIMTAIPPDRPGGPDSRGSWNKEVWRGEVLFALVFAPLGCLLRFYLSARLNGLIDAFPLGTFAANIFGTAVFGMSYDLQRAPLQIGSRAIAGGGRVGCQALQGIEDGFCGCLTTVSTWALELTTLKRRHSYLYGSMSVLVGLALVVIIMGSVTWTIGLSQPVCAVEVS